MIRSSRLAEPQFIVALDMADPRVWDSIAGTLIEAMAAARESTTRAFWDLVFCRILMITAISVNVTAKALTISATATNICRFMLSARCELAPALGWADGVPWNQSSSPSPRARDAAYSPARTTGHRAQHYDCATHAGSLAAPHSPLL